MDGKMNELRLLVVDDEPLARRRLRRLLKQAGLEEVDECRSGEQAVAAIQADPPDLVLLDVQMPGMDGFDVVQAVGVERMPTTIFVTAYDEYALRAFEVHALDYLLKPVEEERLQTALRRARARLEQQATAWQRQVLASLLGNLHPGAEPPAAHGREASGGRYLERLLVTMGGQPRFLRACEIDWIAAEGNYARLHVGERSCLIRETMGVLEKKLDPRHFLRAHRSTIVNLERIAEIYPAFGGNYVIRLSNGVELAFSRSYRQRMQDTIATYT